MSAFAIQNPLADLHWPDGISWVGAPDRQALATTLAQHVAAWLRDGLADRERVSLAVSGGRTPVDFFRSLSQQTLPWPRVEITLADERWVEPDQEASNERLVRNHLLQGDAQAASFVGLKTAAETARQGLVEVESRLAAMTWPLEVLVLGMGNDGHTASLFPGTDGLSAALAEGNTRRCAAIQPLDAPHERVTLTYAAMAKSRHPVLHLVGEDKLETLRAALMNLEDCESMPIRAFIKTGLHIFWSP